MARPGLVRAALVLLLLLACQGVAGVPLKKSTTGGLGGREVIGGLWEQLGRAPRESEVSLTFLVTIPLEGREKLRAKFSSVSDPDSPGYTQYWTRSELFEHTSPRAEDLRTVSAWVQSAGLLVSDRDIRLGFLHTRGGASQVESLLGVRMFEYKHTTMHVRILRTMDTPAVPAGVSGALECVAGLHNFPSVQSRGPTQEEAQGPFGPPSVTPEVLKSLYGFDSGRVLAGGAFGSEGVAEWQLQTFSPSDLRAFERKHKLPPQQPRKITGHGNWIARGEGTLDVQYIIAVSAAQAHTDGSLIPCDYWLSPGLGFDVLAWIGHVASSEDSPLVWSVSYGEALETITPVYAKRLNAELQKLATLGVTVIFASGDTGVFSRTGGFRKFEPTFPACLPAVTAVGATQLEKNGSEISAVDWSGGGFSISEFFTREEDAPWQSSAVASYFNSTNLPPWDMWDRGGRGFPDVAVVGVGYKIQWHGVPMTISGTSASAPVFAAMISLLNDERMHAGKRALGFLNPVLYAKGTRMFKDIVVGRNDNGGLYGFAAAPGWDPASGWGTPVYQKMREVAMALP